MGWIAGGLCADVPPGTVVPICVDGVDLAVWCSQKGTFSAWGDRCPHRGMRLSHGFVRGETLSCIYHGWQYDEAGSCAYIPAHPALTPPKTICAKSYLCSAKDGVIWVSLTETTKEPPDIGNRKPVRSLPFDCSPGDLGRLLKTNLHPVIVVGGSSDLALAVQPVSDRTCMVHALAAEGHDPKAVSRQLEDMRRAFEEQAA
ncbi:Rieske 2Fe-2S domain-containing protein [Hoeflea prorocentri]|uniref:Rieske 2Fe-2S domain-containing protein n=1 Tax=Hoeflea prorocentri TaxID=1922333 RepID=A0A9X3UFX9_9HYPH|nr:Rieske 2Fe-2S domain-containing protein [Hoeflea prorocentri]MCY6380078.1 Rieske 2Fe-2S domain-containing protein [Hoeflea prorocentri]MDA5397878.1 Rieske 2Fe-2S domain-containing protein [Hoeflea prorocentri]